MRLTGSPLALLALSGPGSGPGPDRLHGSEGPALAALLESGCGLGQAHRGPVVVNDATAQPQLARLPAVAGSARIRAWLGVPLASEAGPLGMLWVLDRAPRQYGRSEVAALTGLADMLGTTLGLQDALAQAKALALTDPLTELPNRRALLDAVSRAISLQRRDRQPFALLYLDLDGFKQVNDRQGHAEGDRVLAEVAAALRGSIRREDMAARIGGDEFAALLIGGNGEEAGLAAERIRQAVARRMAERGWPVTVSVGAVSFLSPPKDEAEALSAADELMYAAKAGGRNRVLRRDYLRPLEPSQAPVRPARALPERAVGLALRELVAR